MIFSTLLDAIATILSMVINIYIWIVIISALLSFVNPDPYNPFVQTLHKLTQPVYSKIRGKIPTTIGGVDLAPLIVILALKFIDLSIVEIISKISKGV